MRLLWADLDHEHTDSGSQFFERCGVSVDVANHPLELVTCVVENAYDVIFVDDQFMDDTATLFSWIRSNSQGKHLPSFLVSGADSPNEMARWFHIPPTQCLQKPYSPATAWRAMMFAEPQANWGDRQCPQQEFAAVESEIHA